MTNKQITLLIKETVANAVGEIFNDPDIGKTVNKSFVNSVIKARQGKDKSLTINQFRKQYGF